MANTKIPVELSSTPGIVDGSNATAITIDSSERVGIGVTPSDHSGYMLQITGGSQSFIAIGNDTTGTGALNGLIVGNDSTGADIYQRENQPLRFHTNNTERMRIDSSGQVGIGTTSPRGTLDLGSGSGDGTLSNTSSDYQLILEAAQSTTGDIGRNIAFVYSTNNVSAAINSYDAGSGVTNGLTFATAASGTLSERMQIDSNGKVTVDPAGNFFDDSAGVLQLRASTATGGWAISARSTVTTSSGTWFIGKQSNGTNVFSLVSDSDSIDLTFLSDERMKMNITDSADVLDKVKQITVKDFDWRTELNGDTKDDIRETKKYGFIAQNFQSIGLGQYVKELMPTDENDDTLGMDYGNITPILVKAIQEQQELIETQQTTINDLKSRIETLEG